jgi:hypothetical protein
VRFAYADPPYPGQAERLYGDHPDYDGEVDYSALILRLVEEFPDGWALSCGVRDLQDILPICPCPVPSPKRRRSFVQGTGVRVLAWVKPMTPIKPQVSLQYGWEPVILCGGRRRTMERGLLRDWLACSPVNPARVNGGVVGMKPDAFSCWLFEALGAEPDDELVDLFPGSGAVAAAWDAWRRAPQMRFAGPLTNTPLFDGEAA